MTTADDAGGPGGRTERPGTVRIDVLTILPDVVEAFASASLIGKARADGVLDIRIHDLRDATTDVHRTVDDAPFGGGAGMVLKPEPIFDTVERVVPPRPLIYLSPGRSHVPPGRRPPPGRGARVLAAVRPVRGGRRAGPPAPGRRGAVDRRLRAGRRARSRPQWSWRRSAGWCRGCIGNAESVGEESFSDGLLEYPHYTRPAEYRGWTVPEVLRSGNHGLVARWRSGPVAGPYPAGPAGPDRGPGRPQPRRSGPAGRVRARRARARRGGAGRRGAR